MDNIQQNVQISQWKQQQPRVGSTDILKTYVCHDHNKNSLIAAATNQQVRDVKSKKKNGNKFVVFMNFAGKL